MNVRAKVVASAMLGVVLVGGLQGCFSSGGAGKTTCKAFAEMGSSTGLGSDLTSKQQKVISKMLKDHHAVSGQDSMAAFQVIAYCNIYNGQAGSHENQPIENIPGLQN